MTRTDRVERVIEAGADRIYAAMTDPAALVRWLPPTGMTGRFEGFDLRMGGGYRMVLRYRESGSAGKAGDGSDVVEARFVALDRGSRVVQEADFVSDDPAFAGTMTMTWQITPLGRRCRVEFRADQVPDGISAGDHAAGMSSSLQNLADYLASLD